MTVFYDNSFNLNEWYVILNLLLGLLLIWWIRKIFSKLEGLAYFIFGIAYGMFYDHTISIKPWDFYDVNDASEYQIIDFISYVMYGPYSYFFVYLYVKWNIRGFWNLFYVLGWSCFSLLSEWIALKVGLFHYDKGYQLSWSFPIYILAQSMLIIFYLMVKSSKGKGR